MTFAAATTVSPERSKAEIEELLRKYGADQFISGWEHDRAMIGFRCHNRYIRFELKLPEKGEHRFTHVKHRGRYFETKRSEQQAFLAWEQEVRRLWRALALVIKAKLEAVQSEITTFEHEFMAHIVMPDGKTVAQHIQPRIAEAYQTGRVPLLLPAREGS